MISSLFVTSKYTPPYRYTCQAWNARCWGNWCCRIAWNRILNVLFIWLFLLKRRQLPAWKVCEKPKIIKVSPYFGVSVPYFHGGYSKGHFELRAMSGRGSTKSVRYRPTTNEKPSETMFQRVLLDFVLKTFGLGAENETRAHAARRQFLANYI